MANLEYLICPSKHPVEVSRENFARDFSDGDKDVMSGLPIYEIGFYCLKCDRAYGVSKLQEPSKQISNKS